MPHRNQDPDRPQPIFLDDAVLVLQTMTIPVKARAPLHAQPDAPAPLFFAYNKSPMLPASGSNFPHQQPQPAEGDILNSLKRRTRCHACSRYGHWKGDPTCVKKKQRTNDGSRSQPQQQKAQQASNELDLGKGF
jgi:hypothetical protein